MSNLILSSNYVGNKLEGVGEATLENETILIKVEPNTVATLLRGVNKVILLQPKSVEQFVSGTVKLGDVYVLDNFDKKITIKIENKNVKHETSLYIDNEKIVDATSNKRKTTMTAGVVILFFLLASVFVGIKQKKSADFNSVSEVKLNQAILNYDLKTRESFTAAKDMALKLKSDGYKNDKLDELLKKIQESEAEILGEINSEVSDFLDLSLQINGFNGTKMVSTSDAIFVLDENEKNIIQLDINGKNAKIVAKKDVLDGLISIASYENRLFTLNKDGIYEINNSRTKVKDLDWGDSLFYLYSANIYMVDKGNNKIYRFSGNNKTFADKVDWLAPGIEADFSKACDMSIDGSIWVLSSSGRITRFTNGNPTNISVDGIVTPLENPTAIYTNENLKNVYVLDKQNGRVVVIDKSGKFKMQYISENIKNANDLVVSEEKEKIILLNGSKLESINLATSN